MTADRADHCMLVNKWGWSRSRVRLLRLEVDLGSVLESELGQRYGQVYAKRSLKWKKGLNGLTNIMFDKGTCKRLIVNHNFSRCHLVVLCVRQWHLLSWPFNYNILPTRWVCSRSAKMVTPVVGKYYNVEEHIIMQSHPQCTTSTYHNNSILR